MLHVIASQTGQTEKVGADLSGAVIGYLAEVGLQPVGGHPPPWGAALLAWAARRSGLEPPPAAGEPASWIGWGTPLAFPKAGSVAVLTGGGRPGFLCGVVARVQGARVYVIGAFDGVVQTRAFPIEQVIAARGCDAVPQLAAIPAAPHAFALPAPPALPVSQIQPPESQPAPASISTEQIPQHHGETAVTTEHLKLMLDLMKEKFADLDNRIDTVQRHAVGGITILEAQ